MGDFKAGGKYAPNGGPNAHSETDISTRDRNEMIKKAAEILANSEV